MFTCLPVGFLVWGFAPTLREKESTVKIILMTGHPMEARLEDLRAQGLNGWLSKPPGLEDLAEVISQVLLAGDG